MTISDMAFRQGEKNRIWEAWQKGETIQVWVDENVGWKTVEQPDACSPSIFEAPNRWRIYQETKPAMKNDKSKNLESENQDSEEPPIPVSCVEEMEWWKFRKRKEYFLKLISTKHGSLKLEDRNGEEFLWQLAVKAEKQERFMAAMAAERVEQAFDENGYSREESRDPRTAKTPCTFWDVEQMLLWEVVQQKKY